MIFSLKKVKLVLLNLDSFVQQINLPAYIAEVWLLKHLQTVTFQRSHEFNASHTVVIE